MTFHTKLCSIALIAVMGSSPIWAESHSETDATTVVATVNGTEITLGQLIIARAQLPSQYQQIPDDQLFEGLLDQMIQQQLLADTLEETPARVDWALSNQERSLKAGEVVTDLLEETVTEEALAAAYAERFADFDGETEWNASHILVETEEEAASIKLELDAGADFAQMASERSTGPSGPSGGSLGWFTKGMMVPPFEESVASLEVGQISDPVQTQFGWHVIILNDSRLQSAPELDAVRGELEAGLQQAAIEARVAELTESGDISRPAPGEFDSSALSNLDLLEK